jgi:hypothetical protein
MPLQTSSCGECGRSESVCPECGSSHVSPRVAVHVEAQAVLGQVTHILDHTPIEQFETAHVCWNCGWEEQLTVTIEREQTHSNTD